MDWPGDLIAVILAVIFGSAIGMERELCGKAAGLRTNVLICLGAAVFTIISREVGGQNDSITRIAAQIVTGVGFLGAGAIIQDRGGVHGLTTAATIWLVASIGMACGAKFYALAFIATLIAIGVLIGLAKIEKIIKRLRAAKKDNPTTQ
ncbi:MAG: MgtC/SapB family protein [Sedimentisphaerales bacterium]|jgi:putative Mg2+ transporter-C (MgtC) family protein|nr:MgtC/SapB family protein [Sedimentisphaerales bacterium]